MIEGVHFRSCTPSLVLYLCLYTQRITLQFLNHIADLVELACDTDALRTVRLTLMTADAMVWLTFTRYNPIERDQILTTMTAIFRIAYSHWQGAFILTLVIMDEDGWYIDTIRTGHTIFAVITRNVLQTYDLLGDIPIQIALFFLCEWYKRTI
jgi:hypothetical protein